MFQVFLPFKYYQKNIGFATNCGLMTCCIYLLWTLLPLSVPFLKYVLYSSLSSYLPGVFIFIYLLKALRCCLHSLSMFVFTEGLVY